jgi:hypothetical protein
MNKILNKLPKTIANIFFGDKFGYGFWRKNSVKINIYIKPSFFC